MITKEHILSAQESWGNGIVALGKEKVDASDFLNEHYLDGSLVKPTLVSENAFRLNSENLRSYFVGGCCEEDTGFALKPWSAVRFVNAGFILGETQASAMGHYFFSHNGEETKVEYSFGYTLVEGVLKINLHHSSLPYSA